MTRRERLEAKLEKRRNWAESRDRKAERGFQAASRIADGIPLGQPILVGHHSEKRHRRDIERIDAGMRAGVESSIMASHHRSKADGLERQLEGSIFSDDPDAVDALETRIAELEAKLATRKRINALYRKGDAGALLAEFGMDLEKMRAKLAGDWHGVPWPPYSISNMRGNIRRLRQRVGQVEARQERQAAAHASPGGVLVEGESYVAVTFEEKPDRSILDALRAAGFFWSGGS
jgi:uncharacterized coiled-coil protein SlyX